MSKRDDTTLMRVSKNFKSFISNTKSEIRIKTGKELSDADMTEIYAILKPIVQLPEKKKRNSILDF